MDEILKHIGKIITSLTLKNDELHFQFDDGSKVKILDNGQSCCECRYMQTDDNLEDACGTKFIGILVKTVPSIKNIGDEDGVHEIEFLEIQTDNGVFTMASHNEHNGYYGGFDITSVAE